MSVVVDMCNKHIFKSTLDSQLNGNLMLSKDCLTRVREGIYFNRDVLAQGFSNGQC